MGIRKLSVLIIVFSSTLILLDSCKRKEDIITDTGSLEFSTDTVFFDTVFTTITTVTKRVMVRNPQKNAVEISKISIDATSPFSLVIDGRETNSLSDYTLRGGDSLLILVKAKLGENNPTDPYIFNSPIQFTTNSNQQQVVINAVGQDIYLHKGIAFCDTTWKNDKPHVLYNAVQVNEGCTLTIEANTKVYCHGGTFIQVFGTLKVNGTAAEPVIFTDDRLDAGYEDVPGIWEGIFFFDNSADNVIDWAHISNSVNGIYCYTPDTDDDYNLEIYNTIINTVGGNSLVPSQTGGLQGYGFVGFKSDVYMENTLITNCLTNGVACLVGDNYSFVNCTFANYSFMFSRDEDSRTFAAGPLLLDGVGGVIDAGETNVSLVNTIIWGSNKEELQLGSSTTDYPLNFAVNSSIIRTQEHKADLQQVIPNLVNKNPLFVDKNTDSTYYDFNIPEDSPARDAGTGTPFKSNTPTDLNGVTRSGQYDIGAYENQ